ncbi:MAG: hypothetical protein QOG15_1588 [Solirubrobacteraceae bacterium]|jgi:hypothetical protein|nr:hypothetical protein [Solirubrobacteraceae bacterium]
MRTCSAAAILAAASVALVGCASGTASLDTAPVAAVRVAQASITSAAANAARAATPPPSTRAVQRRSAVPPRSGANARELPTPPGSRRSRTPEPSAPLPASAAQRLAAPACEQYLAARAGHFPAVVAARGEARALAVMTDSVAAALLGLPIVAPGASLAARLQLDAAHVRLAQALAAGQDPPATAIARAANQRIGDYAQALGIAECG